MLSAVSKVEVKSYTDNNITDKIAIKSYMILYLVLILDPIAHAQVHTKTAYDFWPTTSDNSLGLFL